MRLLGFLSDGILRRERICRLGFSDQEVLGKCPFLCRCQFREDSLELYRLATKWTLRNSQKFGSGFGVRRTLAGLAAFVKRS